MLGIKYFVQVGRIGAGGQGTMYLAQQRFAEHSKVAIKVWNDGANQKAFQMEVHNLRTINHRKVSRFLFESSTASPS